MQNSEDGATTRGTRPGQYTLVATFDGTQWASLCRELDVASFGTTAADALDRLAQAIHDALDYERDTGVSAGDPVPEPAFTDFLESAHGASPPVTKLLTV